MANVTVKQKILNALSKSTLTVAQARARFNASNISARVSELRKAGYPIQTNVRVVKGQKRSFYQLNIQNQQVA